MTEGNSVNLKIYVLDDNDFYNRLLVHNLKLNPDYDVRGFTSPDEFFTAFKEAPDIVTLDYRLPNTDGMEVLNRIREINDHTDVIVISEQGDIETAVGLLKSGAYDYIVKSNDIRERLHHTIRNIVEKNKLKSELSHLKKEVQEKYGFQKSIIGESSRMKNVFSLIEKSLRTNISVSITGETGTGKEVVAKAIHYNSTRKEEPFVAINVAAIPTELIESELFGHEKGAFTGAVSSRIGKFEEAGNGTLFLDEIGDMPEDLQVKLLRVLQEKEVVRIGGNKRIKTDCRIITATNKNLKNLVKEGKFREDLFYRIQGLSIELPPLRERENDVLLLARHFLNQFLKENRMENKTITSDVQKKLLAYSFPGNVRELRSIIELAATMSVTNEFTTDDILMDSGEPNSNLLGEEMTMRKYELNILQTFLKKYDHDVKLVAVKLDISVATIYRMMKELEE